MAVGLARCDKTSKDLIKMMVSDRIFSNLPQRTGGMTREVKDRQQMNAGNGLY